MWSGYFYVQAISITYMIHITIFASKELKDKTFGYRCASLSCHGDVLMAPLAAIASRESYMSAIVGAIQR